MSVIGEINNAFNLLKPLINEPYMSSHKSGFDTIVKISNKGTTSLHNIQVSIDEPDKYYWDDYCDSPTIDLSELAPNEEQSFVINSRDLGGSKAKITIFYNGVIGAQQSKRFELKIFSRIDQA